MLILGLHMGHDASVTVLESGRILGVYEKERHTGARHDFFVNADDILAACRMFGVDVADVDSVAVTSSQGIPVFFEEHDRFQFTVDWDRPIPGLTHPGSNLIEWYTKMSEAREPWARIRLEETLARGLQDGEVLGVPGRTRPIDWTESSALYAYENPFCPKIWHQGLTLETMRRAHPDGLAELMSHRAEQTGCVPLSVSLLGHDLPGVLVPHHLAHAASVYFTGTSDHAAILTVDGTFDSGVAGMGMGLYARGRGNKISAFLPNFLTSANFFFRVAAALRLTGELPGKLMGLSSYGEHRFSDRNCWRTQIPATPRRSCRSGNGSENSTRPYALPRISSTDAWKPPPRRSCRSTNGILPRPRSAISARIGTPSTSRPRHRRFF